MSDETINQIISMKHGERLTFYVGDMWNDLRMALNEQTGKAWLLSPNDKNPRMTDFDCVEKERA